MIVNRYVLTRRQTDGPQPALSFRVGFRILVAESWSPYPPELDANIANLLHVFGHASCLMFLAFARGPAGENLPDFVIRIHFATGRPPTRFSVFPGPRQSRERSHWQLLQQRSGPILQLLACCVGDIVETAIEETLHGHDGK